MQNTHSHKIRKTYLYRYFDASGILLYVGITRSISKRHSSHEAYSPWFKEHAKMAVEIFPSQHEAAVAERAAIAKEKPKYNGNLGGATGGNAFDTVVISARLTHEEAARLAAIVKARGSNRTEVLRELIKSLKE